MSESDFDIALNLFIDRLHSFDEMQKKHHEEIENNNQKLKAEKESQSKRKRDIFKWLKVSSG